MDSLIPNTSPLDEVLRIMAFTSADLTIKTQQNVAGLFADHQFMENLQDIGNMAYGKCDADLPQYLGTHGIVPDTDDRLLRRIILAYLIACKQSDCAAALDKFMRAYGDAVAVFASRQLGAHSPDWKLRLVAKD